MGAQDDFAYALRFVADTGVSTPTMLWERPGATWRQYGVRSNSSLILLNGSLTEGTQPFLGFSASDQQRIVDQLAQFS